MSYLRYAVRRLSAYPNIWWSLANEYDTIADYEHEWWSEFAALIRREESCIHNLSNHQFFWKWDLANRDTTHLCLQSSAFEEVPEMILKFQKPVIFDECGYEGDVPFLWGNLSGFELVNRFWKAYSIGAYCTYGETFCNEQEILWWSKGGTLKGESVPRIAFLKEILESLPGNLTCEILDEQRNYFEKGRKGIDELIRKGKTSSVYRNYPEELLLPAFRTMVEMRSHYKDEVFMLYNERQCRKYLDLELPETGRYCVEVIDVWNMTQSIQFKGVSGRIRVELPGKEGVAILARKESQSKKN